MPIRIVEDPGQGGGNNRRRPGGGGGSGGGANLLKYLLPLIIRLFRKNPKMALLLLVVGGGFYFYSVRTGNNQIADVVELFRGCDMSPEMYEKSEIYEPLSTSYKGSLPKKVSLEEYCPKRLNQGRQGSCVGWASSYAARTILHAKATGEDPNSVAFSPASLYNQISLPKCQGAYIHNAMDVMKGRGVLPWRDFGYDEKSCSRKLNAAQFDKAAQFTTRGFQRLWKNQGEVDIAAIKQNLAQGAPVVIGMMVGGSFMQNMRGKSTWVPSKRDYNQRGFGGHAMCVIGYDDDKQALQIMNSWGPEWGKNGIAWVSYKDFVYFTKEAYGLYPMGDAEAVKAKVLEIDFGLVDNATKKNIAVESAGKRGMFRTVQPVKKGSPFKIEVTNTAECYTYVFGMETDGSSYRLFPYTDKHSPYCGIVGTRLFPRTQSLVADEIGDKDYMAVVITKKEIDHEKLNTILNQQPQVPYYERVKQALRKLEVDVKYEKKTSETIHIQTEAETFKATFLVFEIFKS